MEEDHAEAYSLKKLFIFITSSRLIPRSSFESFEDERGHRKEYDNILSVVIWTSKIPWEEESGQPPAGVAGNARTVIDV